MAQHAGGLQVGDTTMSLPPVPVHKFLQMTRQCRSCDDTSSGARVSRVLYGHPTAVTGGGQARAHHHHWHAERHQGGVACARARWREAPRRCLACAEDRAAAFLTDTQLVQLVLGACWWLTRFALHCRSSAGGRARTNAFRSLPNVPCGS